jgi:hypothetical protein
MKQINQATCEIIDQLTDLAENLSLDDFSRPLKVLLENSVGQHYRHIIEFYEVMIGGVRKGEINYDSRKHEYALEQSKQKCLERLEGIRKAFALEPAMNMKLWGSYTREADTRFTVSTSIEHAIHHMAIIRVALQHEFPDVPVSAGFGYAYSTLKHVSA